MNREIKFRAWDGHEMWTDFSLNADGTFVHQSISCVATGVNRNGNAVLMQFTGLHDKNGVEIYEGDIVQYTAHKGYLLPDFVAEICYANEYASFGFQVDGDPARWSAFAEFDEAQRDVLDYIVVIGNIHENPELLCN